MDKILLTHIGAIIEDNGRKKLISLDEINKLFVDSVKLSTGILPSNCVNFFRKSRTCIISLLFKPSIETVTYITERDDVYTISRDYPEENLDNYVNRDIGGNEGEDDNEDDEDDEDDDNRSSHSTIRLNDDSVGRGLNKDIKADSSYTFDIPVPQLLYTGVLGIDNDKYFVRKEYIHSIVGEFNYDTELKRAPFSNLYSNGAICWGGNARESVEHLTGLESVKSLFLSAPFNSDLDSDVFNRHGTSIKKTRTLYLFDWLDGNSTFDDSLLPNMCMTYKSFMQRLEDEFS